MNPGVLRLLMVWTALVVVGFGLVLASGYSGDNGGGSELVWRVGGLMMYASIPVFVTALVWGSLALTGQPAVAGPDAVGLLVTFPHAGPGSAGIGSPRR